MNLIGTLQKSRFWRVKVNFLNPISAKLKKSAGNGLSMHPQGALQASGAARICGLGFRV